METRSVRKAIIFIFWPQREQAGFSASPLRRESVISTPSPRAGRRGTGTKRSCTLSFRMKKLGTTRPARWGGPGASSEG
jgi:hypothetical protein